MSSFESGSRVHRGIGVQRVAVGAREKASWPNVRQDDRSPAARLMSEVLGGVIRLVVPVSLLLALAAPSVAYANRPADVLAWPWLTLGTALLPLTFVAVHLANRRFGAAYAFWQVILAWGIAGAAALAGALHGIAPAPLVTREVIGFSAGLFVAQMVAIIIFDRLRGPRWWSAPLYASLFGGVVLCLVGFPSAYFGSGIQWGSRMVDYIMWTCVLSVLLLVPYWMMRNIVRPSPGFGGY